MLEPQKEKINIHSNTWKAVAVWAEEELLAARIKNDKIKLDVIKTSVIRGEIKKLKELLRLGNDQG